MTFVESINTCFKKYAEFNGRATRSEYWWFVLFILLASTAASMLHPMLASLFSLAVLLPSLAAGARRLHDIDKSAWFLLVWLVPFIGWIIMIVLLAQDSKSSSRY